jgi:hypothetical protein
MGCSAGLIAVELVKNMLAAKPNRYVQKYIWW